MPTWAWVGGYLLEHKQLIRGYITEEERIPLSSAAINYEQLIREGQGFLNLSSSMMEWQAHCIGLGQVTMEAIVRECNGQVVSRRRHFTAPLPILWPQQFFQLITGNLVPCALLCKGILLNRCYWFINWANSPYCNSCLRKLIQTHVASVWDTVQLSLSSTVLRTHVRQKQKEMKRCKIVDTKYILEKDPWIKYEF